MIEQEESTGRQIAKIGHRSTDELHGHIGPDGRMYYPMDACFDRLRRRLREYYAAKG